jgi:hypothetical protein
MIKVSRYMLYRVTWALRIKKGQPHGSRTSLVVEDDEEYPLQQL